LKIGLFFGSFNPIHNGHLIIANHILNQGIVKKIWFVISPQNPLKDKSSLLNEFDRLHLVKLAIEDNPALQASQIEFQLPRPSYTIDTLAYLKEKYPSHEFSIIMGGDNLMSFHKWKNYQRLIENHNLIVYKRSETDQIPTSLAFASNKIQLLDVPLLGISASLIRKTLKDKKSIKYLVPEKVNDYIKSTGYYK
jgi:nicotinate-nucleotide adenylyltransferase